MDHQDINPEHRLTIVIEPGQGWRALGLRQLWEYRELVGFLVWRELQGTYRQTALGMSWLFIRPLTNILVLSLAFGVVVNVQSDGVPYPLFAAAALLPWGYFSGAVLRSAGSLVHNTHIISKIYFPRLVLPVSSVLSGLVDLAASFLLFVVLLAVFRMPLRPEVLWLPVFALIAMLVALAFGLWSASLAVKYRDIAFAMAFLLQALMYASPVIYPLSAVPPAVRPLYVLNPMTGVIQGFRWALLGSNEPPGPWFAVSLGLTGVALLAGAMVFRRTERTIVDIL
jgi:lipopolysaccharide transport system permease protein